MKVIVSVVIAILVGASLWVGAHHIGTAPADPYASDDFTPAAGPEENGFVDALRIGDEPAFWEDVQESQSAEVWSTAKASPAVMRSSLEEYADVIAAIENKNRFVENCEPVPDAPCPLPLALNGVAAVGLAIVADSAEFVVARNQRINTVVDPGQNAIDQAKWSALDQRAAALLARARDFDEHSLSLLGFVAAQGIWHRSLATIAVFIEAAKETGFATPLLSAALATPIAERSLNTGIRFDHRQLRTMIVNAQGSLLFDRAQTLRLFDARTAALLDGHRLQENDAPYCGRYYNPQGCEMLDMVAFDADRIREEHSVELEGNEAQRETLRHSLQ